MCTNGPLAAAQEKRDAAAFNAGEKPASRKASSGGKKKGKSHKGGSRKKKSKTNRNNSSASTTSRANSNSNNTSASATSRSNTTQDDSSRNNTNEDSAEGGADDNDNNNNNTDESGRRIIANPITPDQMKNGAVDPKVFSRYVNEIIHFMRWLRHTHPDWLTQYCIEKLDETHQEVRGERVRAKQKRIKAVHVELCENASTRNIIQMDNFTPEGVMEFLALPGQPIHW